MLHVDFHEVDLKQKTTATVPLKAVGESEAVKSGMVLVMMKNELEVEALPTDLPDVIEVDITGLTEVGMSILAKDLKFDRSKVTVELGDDEVIATIQEPAKEEVVEVAPVEGEAAAEGEAKPAEGEPAPAEAAKPESK
jgi:large subunit ribosomal protein L25